MDFNILVYSSIPIDIDIEIEYTVEYNLDGVPIFSDGKISILLCPPLNGTCDDFPRQMDRLQRQALLEASKTSEPVFF